MLKGKSVLLRAVEKNDINVFYDIWSDPEVRKFDGTFVIPPSKEYILQNFNRMMNLHKKYLTIVNKEASAVGYITYKAKIDGKNVYELGITIGKKYWNRGYGQDAIKTLLKYLFMYNEAVRVELGVVDFNKMAIACYQKCGFIKEGIKRRRYFIQGEYKDVVIMGIIKEEFYELYKFYKE